MARTLYSLLVGIDAYESPVPRLRGCVNDIQRIEELLPEIVDATTTLNTITLSDAEASRAAIIAGFQNHLGQAGPNDLALFYYSGHGAFEDAPQEFWAVEPDHRNETLVCHDSRTPGSWDLADKELSALIAEATARGTRLLVVLDCCHSGSGTRSLLPDALAVRSAPDDHRVRPFEDYYLGAAGEFVASREAGRSGWQLPVSGAHVLLAACASDQKAKEVRVEGLQRGAFSVALERALQAHGGRVSYRDLMAAITNELAKTVRNQTPQLECFGDLDSTALFLGGAGRIRDGHWTMSHLDGRWWVDAGSLTGIGPTAGGEPPLFAVFARNTPEEHLTDLSRSMATAIVTGIEPGRSAVDVTTKGAAELDTDELYLCRLLSAGLAKTRVRPPVLPDSDFAAALEESLFARAALPGEEVELVVSAGADGYRVHDALMGPIAAAGTPATRANDAEIVVRQLDHITRWRMVRDLANPLGSISGEDLELEIVDARKNVPLSPDREIRLTYSDPDRYPKLKIKLRNNSNRELYCAMYGLSEDYEIASLLDGKVAAKLAPGEEVWAFGNGNVRAQVPDVLWRQGVTVCDDIIKVVASTEPFDAARLAESALSDEEPVRGTRHVAGTTTTLDRLLARIPTRSLSREPDDAEAVADWVTKSVVVTVERPPKPGVLRDGAADLGNGAELRAPSGVTADVQLLRESATTRDATTPALPRVLHEQSVPLPVWTDRSADDLSVIELHDLTRPELVTPQTPLSLTVPTTLREEETALVVAYDGEDWLPVGHVKGRDSNGTTLVIEQLPAEDVVTKGLFKSIKLMLRKLVGGPLGLPQEYPRLAAATVDMAGEVHYVSDLPGVRAKVRDAHRILLLVHGIIGETTGMVTGTAGIHHLYDLVLAFDYENIHTRIDQNAALLHTELTKAGVDTSKEIDVVAHSMGGLVVRTMIELNGGQGLVNRLVTAGTPNNGSPWPKVQDWATAAVAAALNALPAMTWPIGVLVGAIERFDNALDQMAPNSEFLRGLYAAADPAQHYTVLIGDRALVKDGRSLFRKLFVDPAVALVFFGQPNDIAVTHESGQHLPAGRVPPPSIRVVECDHLTYFSSAAGVDAITAALEP
ncbi:caspase family protein [Lentzea alba]|uniref:DUF7379 domain-containing protein n=1 Tax=Lentzea alba TaxID=2714351 RepID=UPI0039BF5CCD